MNISHRIILYLVDLYITIKWHSHKLYKYVYNLFITKLAKFYIWMYLNKLYIPIPDFKTNHTIHIIDCGFSNLCECYIPNNDIIINMLIRFYFYYLFRYNNCKSKPLFEFIKTNFINNTLIFNHTNYCNYENQYTILNIYLEINNIKCKYLLTLDLHNRTYLLYDNNILHKPIMYDTIDIIPQNCTEIR